MLTKIKKRAENLAKKQLIKRTSNYEVRMDQKQSSSVALV
jgi:hypothetical protein